MSIQFRRVMTCDAENCPTETTLVTNSTRNLKAWAEKIGWFVSHDLDPLERHFCPNHHPPVVLPESVKGVSEEELK